MPRASTSRLLKWSQYGVYLPVLVFFFVTAILAYIGHGIRRDTTNQYEHATPALHAGTVLLAIGEIGGFAVLLAGFLHAQF